MYKYFVADIASLTHQKKKRSKTATAGALKITRAGNTFGNVRNVHEWERWSMQQRNIRAVEREKEVEGGISLYIRIRRNINSPDHVVTLRVS